jgi:NAD(P)-dependent dehydrogenase (short-subunit alcohol dehydrogenase family)
MSLQEIFGVEGTVALVTGAASGLGAMFAEAMAEAGADVVCSDIDMVGLETTVATVEGLGRKALAMRCDVSAEDDVTRMVDTTVAEFGRLDILLNNAGIAARISDGAFDDLAFVKTVSDFIPLGRPAAAAEIKGAAIFLASPASVYICGHLLVTHGGILAK